MTDVDDTPEAPRPPHRGGGRSWALGPAAIVAACCAGPGLLTALGAGAVGTVLGVALRAATLVIPAGTVLLIAFTLGGDATDLHTHPAIIAIR